MSETDIVVCANCGQSKNKHEYEEYAPSTEHDEAKHDWSDADPLSRLKAHVAASDDMTVAASEDNENWQWIAVDCSGRDPEGDSEILSNWVKTEGFAFSGLDRGENIVRFNRQKGE